jgi:ABC-type sugar transport system permease subunit
LITCIDIKNKKSGMMNAKNKDKLFYIVMIALPVLQFIIFYIGVNLNSVLLAFKSYNRIDNAFDFVGLANFKNVFDEFFSSYTIKAAISNSFKVWALCTSITLPLSLLFSFFIYKKFPLKNFFKFALFYCSSACP